MADSQIDELVAEIRHLMSLVKGKAIREKTVYTTAELKELLGVGDKLIQRYRNEGWLSYSKVSDKFWYTKEDVEEFLKKTHRQSFRQ